MPILPKPEKPKPEIVETIVEATADKDAPEVPLNRQTIENSAPVKTPETVTDETVRTTIIEVAATEATPLQAPIITVEHVASPNQEDDITETLLREAAVSTYDSTETPAETETSVEQPAERQPVLSDELFIRDHIESSEAVHDDEADPELLSASYSDSDNEQLAALRIDGEITESDSIQLTEETEALPVHEAEDVSDTVLDAPDQALATVMESTAEFAEDTVQPDEEVFTQLAEIGSTTGQLEPEAKAELHQALTDAEQLLEELLQEVSLPEQIAEHPAEVSSEETETTQEADDMLVVDIETEAAESLTGAYTTETEDVMIPTISATKAEQQSLDSPEIEAKIEQLTEALQRTFEIAGITYDEEELKTMLYGILQADNLQNETDRPDASAVSFDRGMHENLIRLLGQIKQLRHQTNGLHRFIGQFAIARLHSFGIQATAA